MARRNYRLPTKEQKRGCATVPVPREDVLRNGRVPKGCRFHPQKGNGTVLCTPAVAQKVGVLEVERKKPVPRAGEMTKRKYCYVPESPFPYRRDGELKHGCEEDEETGKICCDRSYFRKTSTKKAAKTARSKKSTTKRKTSAKKKTSTKKKKTSAKKKTSRKRGRSQQSLPGVNGLDLSVFGAPLADAFADGSDIFDLPPSITASAGSALALLDDGGETPLLHEDAAALALLDERSGDVLPGEITMPQAHLRDVGDFAMTYFAGTVLAGAGLAATYEVIDRWDYFDDKPVARAGAFIGMGAVPAAVAWWASQDAEYGAEIRTLAAAWGVAFTAVGLLGLIRTLMEKRASEAEDPEDRKALEDAAEHLPWFGRHEHDDDDDDNSDAEPDEEPVEDEIATDTEGDGDPGTTGVPYPHSRFFR